MECFRLCQSSRNILTRGSSLWWWSAARVSWWSHRRWSSARWWTTIVPVLVWVSSAWWWRSAVATPLWWWPLLGIWSRVSRRFRRWWTVSGIVVPSIIVVVSIIIISVVLIPLIVVSVICLALTLTLPSWSLTRRRPAIVELSRRGRTLLIWRTLGVRHVWVCTFSPPPKLLVNLECDSEI